MEERKKEIKIRLLKSEFDQIKNNAKISGLQVAVFCREVALHKKINVKKTTEQSNGYLKEFSRIGNNLNQIAKRMNQENVLNLEEVETIKNQLSLLIHIVNNNDSKNH